MIYGKEDIIQGLSELIIDSDMLQVNIFEDGKYLILEKEVIKQSDLISYFENLDFKTNGGQDIFEFCIIYKNKDLTIQISELETVDKLDI